MSVSVKKLKLDVMRECNNIDCGCYTMRGYEIKKKTRKLASDIFVCEDCYKHKYKQESKFLKSFVKGFNAVLRVAPALLCLVMLFLSGVCLMGYSGVKSMEEIRLREIEVAQVRSLELDTEQVKTKVLKVIDRIERVVMHGEYD